jgi:hypothetical protein
MKRENQHRNNSQLIVTKMTVITKIIKSSKITEITVI